MNSVWEKIISLKPNYTLLPIEDTYKEKMNDLYLKICYYNLFEKYTCGMFDDITPINNVVKDMVGLV